MILTEKRAIELRWHKVSDIISEEIKQILGLCIRCQVNVTEDEFWDAAFINNRLPLPKLCQLLQAVHATPEDWENALPCDGGTDVGDMGMFLAEKLIARHLKIRWEHRLIAANSLWLVGVIDCNAPKICTFSEHDQSPCCGQHEKTCPWSKAGDDGSKHGGEI